MIASVQTDALSKILLDRWHEWLALGKIDITKSDLRCLETSGHRARIKLLWRLDLLLCYARLPVCVRLLRRLDSSRRQMSIIPIGCGVAFAYCPVAVPSWRTIKRLGGIVIALGMATHEKELVGGAFWSSCIQPVDLLGKCLPLRQAGIGLAGVGLINQTKICRGLCQC